MLNIDFVFDYLGNQSYWARGRSRLVVEKSIQNSLCFGVFDAEKQVGFARLVTDIITFAWLSDVFIDEAYQDQGLGKWLIKTIVSHPDMKAMNFILLATSNAHQLYQKYGGFEPLNNPEKWMVRKMKRNSEEFQIPNS